MNSIKGIIEIVLKNPSGILTENLEIASENYEVQLQWEKNIIINLRKHQLFINTEETAIITKSQLLSVVSRYPQYSISGKRSNLTEKMLSNKYTPPLLHFKNSKLIIKNEEISYSAIVKKNDIQQLQKIIDYFEALLITSK